MLVRQGTRVGSLHLAVNHFRQAERRRRHQRRIRVADVQLPGPPPLPPRRVLVSAVPEL